MTKTQVWVMKNKFDGIPKLSDFSIEEEDLPPLRNGDALTEALWWSVDPFNRAYMRSATEGAPMIGYQVGNMTAYFGLLDLNQPKEGETVVVNAAAGAVGSAVGQIAKIKGCHVVGFVGTEEKVAWLKEVGFDAAYNYKKVDLPTVLKESCPNGVDCFFDNVGGSFADAVYPFLNTDARIAQCGAISQYNATEVQKVPDFRASFISRRISLFGLGIRKWLSQFPEGIDQMIRWIEEGKLHYQETRYKGFQKLPQALIDQLLGNNKGKSVIEA